MKSIDQDLKVLTVVMSTPEAKGGAVRAGLTLGKHLGEHVTSDIAKMEGTEDPTLFDELGLEEPVIQLPTVSLISDILSRVSSHTNAFMWPRMALDRPLAEYDIVHLHNAMPLWGMFRVAFACRHSEVPYCVTLHGVSKILKWPDELNLTPVERILFKLTIQKPYDRVLTDATHLFALTERDQALVQERLDVKSISVMPNGIPRDIDDTEHQTMSNLDPKQATNIFEEFEIDVQYPIVLFVGDKRPNKGVFDLLKAHKICETAHELIIAGPSDHIGVQKQIHKMGNHVHDLGYVERDDLIQLYLEADLFVFPTRSDVFPLVILEALAYGTPVISTRVGGIPEMINDSVGRLGEPYDPEQLAEYMEVLLSNEHLRKKMSRKSKEYAKNEFSWSKIARETAEVYSDIV